MTEAQAARVLGISDRTLRRWRGNGAIGYSLTPGGRVRYGFEDIRRLQLNMRVMPSLGTGCPSAS
ncbi:MerR family transcriptional regulator [Sphingomonas populi]|uniref:MerR family transcriptional regulator n=2 Tax=Sphingomonas populi TaxID=2484750 RepID=A0A4Q6Y8Q3_9SPHN|nr:MerR family transcriptional regulator [Sphingomonas populi]